MRLCANRWLPNVVLVVVSSVLCLLLLEAGLRYLVAPSEDSYGILFGKRLPPVQIVRSQGEVPATDHTQPYDHLIVDGRQITVGDLTGLHQEDPLLGYTNEENVISAAGWWQSNNLGARARNFTPSAVPAGKKRMLVFGDSFGQASRVAQEQAWSAVLEADRANLDVINFAVDGYNMAQSLLRYRRVRTKLHYDSVLLMFVPDADLWREINCLRDLVEDWGIVFAPRFILANGQLRLVNFPYTHRSEFLAGNLSNISPQLSNFLRLYDRFYLKYKYDELPVLPHCVICKIVVMAYYRSYVLPKIWDRLMDPNAEAVQVSSAIFRTMKREVEMNGAKFILVVMPGEIWSFRSNAKARQKWKKMLAAICRRDMPCLDLLDPLMRAPDADLDRGYDGSHYGPKANRLIAESVEEGLVRLGLMN